MSRNVTVVIVNYNGAHLLRPCLDGLRKQDYPAENFTTVVVDNDSHDGSVELLRAEYPEVEIIQTGANLGFAGGNNAALRGVDTPLVALLNNDAVPDPTWLRELIAPFDAPDADGLAVTTGKVVFMPRFVRLDWEVPGFSPGVHDPRELGARVFAVRVAASDSATPGDDVAAKVLWERLTYGVEGAGDDRFWWTRARGELLVPLPAELECSAVTITFEVAGEPGRSKTLRVAQEDHVVSAAISGDRSTVRVDVPATAPRYDVINNVGGIVLAGGYGADRGFEEIDRGQYDEPEEVFTACGNGMAIRTSVGRTVGWFDDDFFMYYEDTDLSWRIRARGWSIRYVPTARLRHVHAASSKAWSPRWVFHVDRNRLLMLTKDARAALAVRAVLRYVLSAGSMGLRSAVTAARLRQRPHLAPHIVRAKVMTSYVRLAPRMLRKRRALERVAAVSKADLESWMVSSR